MTKFNTFHQSTMSLSMSSTEYDPNELSVEQNFAFQKFVKGENLFVTGPGGTGKSRLIKHFVQHATKIGKPVSVCAMTGCAAILLGCNAKTLHSWSGIKLANGDSNAIVARVIKNKTSVANWKRVAVLILDEVSMLSAKLITILDDIGRRVRRNPVPFGGIQVVFTGDFFQLPPVPTEGEPDTELFCFESPVWAKTFKQENILQLTTMFRQADPVYIDILNQIRTGVLDEDKKRILQSYVGREYKPELHENCVPTKLFAIRSKTDYVNNTMFAKLKCPEHVYEIVKKTNCLTYIANDKPIDPFVLRASAQLTREDLKFETDFMIQNSPCQQVLRLKIGTAVMCTFNLDLEKNICNGSQGVVIGFVENGDVPIVKFANGVVQTMVPHYWQSENVPIVAIGQIPLCLAWALTIHKIQGTTLDMAEIDIGQSIFEYGQSYVALSRVKSLEGLYLSAFHPQKIKANPKVIAFYHSIPVLDVSTVPSSSSSMEPDSKKTELKEEEEEEEKEEEEVDVNDVRRISIPSSTPVSLVKKIDFSAFAYKK